MLKSNINSKSILSTQNNEELVYLNNDFSPDKIEYDEGDERIIFMKDGKVIKAYELLGYDFSTNKSGEVIAFIGKDLEKTKGKGSKIKYIENGIELLAFDSFNDFSLNKKIGELGKQTITFVAKKELNRVTGESISFLMNGTKEVFSTKELKNANITSYDISNDGSDYVCVVSQDIDEDNKSYLLIRNGVVEFTSNNSPIEQVQLSNDRKNIAFITGFDSGQTIVYHNGKLIDVYLRAADPTFSPDGKHIAFVAKDDTGYFLVMDSRESSERYEDIGSIVFSPDGSEFSTVVVYNGEFRLIKGGKMLSDKIYEMPTIVYSPDSKEISYISYAKAYSKGYGISKGGKVGKKYYMCNPPLYSSNGKIFGYTAEKEQVNQNSALKIEKERDYNDHLLTLTDNFLIVNGLELPFPKVDNFTYLNKLDSGVVPPLSEGSETILVTIKNIDTEWKIYRQLEIVDNTYAIIRELDYDEAGKLFSVNNKFKYIKLIPGKESKETKGEWLDGEFIEGSKYIQLSNGKKYIRTLVGI